MKPKAQVALTKGHRSKAHEPFGEEGDRATEEREAAEELDGFDVWRIFTL